MANELQKVCSGSEIEIHNGSIHVEGNRGNEVRKWLQDMGSNLFIYLIVFVISGFYRFHDYSFLLSYLSLEWTLVLQIRKVS